MASALPYVNPGCIIAVPKGLLSGRLTLLTNEHTQENTRQSDWSGRRAFWNKAGYYICAPANIIVSDSKYPLGVLNSKVTRYLVAQSAAARQGGYLEYKPMYIAPLAIPEKPRNESISELVDSILSATSKDPKANVSKLERQIDQLVYQLYGLTEEEIAVVEGKSQ
jgi:hypothetical protein